MTSPKMTPEQFAERLQHDREANRQRTRISIAARLFATAIDQNDLSSAGQTWNPARLLETDAKRIKARGALRIADALLEEAARTVCPHDFVHGRFAFDQGKPVDLGSACATCGAKVEGGPQLVAVGPNLANIVMPLPIATAGTIHLVKKPEGT